MYNQFPVPNPLFLASSIISWLIHSIQAPSKLVGIIHSPRGPILSIALSTHPGNIFYLTHTPRPHLFSLASLALHQILLQCHGRNYVFYYCPGYDNHSDVTFKSISRISNSQNYAHSALPKAPKLWNVITCTKCHYRLVL